MQDVPKAENILRTTVTRQPRRPEGPDSPSRQQHKRMNRRTETSAGGIYQLLIFLPKATRIRVGKLGTFTFPAGLYVYTGSALNGLEQRLARHQRRRKRLHWHIDYLLRHARIESIYAKPTAKKKECELNRTALRLPGSQVLVRGFGSSDCRCEAHLVYLGETVSLPSSHAGEW